MDSAVTLSIIAGGAALAVSIASRVLGSVDKDLSEIKTPRVSSRAELRNLGSDFRWYLDTGTRALRHLRLLVLIGLAYCATSIGSLYLIDKAPDSILNRIVQVVSIVAGTFGVVLAAAGVISAMRMVSKQQKSIEKKVSELKQLARK